MSKLNSTTKQPNNNLSQTNIYGPDGTHLGVYYSHQADDAEKQAIALALVIASERVARDAQAVKK